MMEEFIQDWHWDEPSHDFARQVGKYLFEFLDHLRMVGLSERTIRKHKRNCQAIGYLTCLYGYHHTFCPRIFATDPSYLWLFKRKFSDSRYAVASYQATWRRLERYTCSRLADGGSDDTIR
jgi:hypothetical protein